MIKETTADVRGIGQVAIRKGGGIKNLRISVSPTRGIVLSVPYMIPLKAALIFLKSKKKWIAAARLKQQKRYEDTIAGGCFVPPLTDEKEIGAAREKAREILLPEIKILSERYGFKYNRIFIKNNRSNWGSCSAKGNINLNMRLIFLPSRLREYAILHELCHLKHPNHGKEFHILLDTLCGGNEKTLSKELRMWKIL